MTEASWASSPPTMAPTAEAAGPHFGNEVPFVQGTPEQRKSHGRRRLLGIASAAAAVALVGGVLVVRSGEEHSASANAAEVAGLTGGEVYDACPDGMFNDGPFEASLDVSNVGDLNRRPESTMNSADDLVDFEFGKNGVACESALTLSVIEAGVIDMLGEGAARTYGFDTMSNVNEQADLYAANEDAAGETADKLGSIVKSTSQLNPQALTGSYFQVVGTPSGEKATASLSKVDVNFDPNTVFVTVVGGDGRVNNQIMVTDRETDQKYFLNSIGTIPEITPEQQEQLDQADNSGGGSANKQSKGGGNNANQHNGDNEGCNGGCGEGGTDSGNGNGEGEGGGGECSGECGGGCGVCNPTTPTTKNPTTPTTKKPTTPTTPTTPPPTNPPTTLPPKDTPSTLPPPPPEY